MTTEARFLQTFQSNPESLVIRKSVSEAPDEKGKLKADYVTIRRRVSDADAAAHLDGKVCLVLKPELADGTCTWAMLDHDHYVGETCQVLREEIQMRELALYPFPSKSGGLHSAIFFREPQPTPRVRDLLRNLAAELGDPDCETFPKEVSPGKLPFGIALPFFGEREEFEAFEPKFYELPVNGNGNGNGNGNVHPEESEPYGVKLPAGTDFHALLVKAGFKFNVRNETGGGISYDYHVGGQPCLIAGHVHEANKGNPRCSRFIVKNGYVSHQCFDSDCQSVTIAKTRAALRTLGLEAEDKRDGFPATEGENADRFAAQHSRDVRYCSEQHVWYAWDGKKWQRDAIGEVSRRARETALSMLVDARRMTVRGGEGVSEEDKKKDVEKKKRSTAWALRADSKHGLDAMIAIARYDSRIEVRRFDEAFDRDPMLLNCQNGIVDLKTGDLGPHRREAMMTKITPVSCDPACGIAKFVAYVKRTFGGSEEMISFKQRFGGYCLTGSTAEQAVFIVFGETGTAKSTDVKLTHGLMGEYAVQIPGKVLLDKPAHAKDYDSALLAGVRLATTVETGADRKLDEEAIKAITGQDILRGERKYENSFAFRSQAKLILATNYRPNVRESDDAIWRRIKPIPFLVKVSDGERVDSFEEKLIEAEGPGILAWYVAGAVEWNKRGLDYPDEVTEAAATYRREQDEVQEFLDECCETDGSNLLSKVALFAEYVARTTRAKMRPMTKKRFGMEMKRIGYAEGSGRDHVKWASIRFNAQVRKGIEDRELREKAATIEAKRVVDSGVLDGESERM